MDLLDTLPILGGLIADGVYRGLHKDLDLPSPPNDKFDIRVLTSLIIIGSISGTSDNIVPTFNYH